MINNLPNINENNSEYSIYLSPDPEIKGTNKVICLSNSIKSVEHIEDFSDVEIRESNQLVYS